MFYGMKRWTFLFALLFLSAFARAQEISFSAGADRDKLALNEYFVYSLTVTGDSASLPEPKLENLEDFNIYGSGLSQSISLVNGKRKGRLTASYTLAPKKVGKFTIPPAKLEYGNKVYSAEPVTVEVTEASGIRPSAAARTRPAAQSGEENFKPDVFVKASVNKKNVYVNEKLVYKFGFYTNVDLVSNPQYYAPDFKGFWKDASVPSTRYETVNGVNYLVNEIETTLYPIESGKAVIGASKLKIAVMDFSAAGSSDDFFGLFMNMGQRKEKMLETEEAEVTVLPLPSENKPEGFSGAVGDFKMLASADKTETVAGDPVTLTVRVTGKGNMKSVGEINFKSGNDFKVYDTVSSDVSVDSREFQILMIPLTPGEKTIEPVTLVFFNPDRKAYQRAQTPPIKIKVTGEPVSSGENAAQSGTVAASAVKNDIYYNKQLNKISSCRKGYLVQNGFFLAAFSGILLFFACLLIFRFYSLRKNGDASFVLKSEAEKSAKKSMEAAGKAASGGQCHDFYENLYQALVSAVTAKTGERVENFSSSRIARELKNGGFGEEKTQEVKDMLDKINFYRFASVRSDEKNMRELFEKAGTIINALGKRQ